MALDLSMLHNIRLKPGGGHTAQCPACHARGDDQSGDHLVVYPTGAFGCVLFPRDKEHRRQIASLAGDNSDDWKRDDMPGKPNILAPRGSASQDESVQSIRAGIPPTVADSGEIANFEKWYGYHNSAGSEIYVVVRYRFREGAKKKKTFRQFNIIEGVAQPVLGTVEKEPYRLPEVLKADTIWIVEGEKDADCLASLGLVATCNAGGAGKWEDRWSAYFAGKTVILCGDTDEPGMKHMDTVEGFLGPVAHTLKRVNLTEHKDISDALHGRSPQDASAFLANLVENHPKSKLSFRTPIELFALTFDDSDNYLGDRMLAAGLNSVLAGPGGVGKSRLLMQLALCCITGRDFLGMRTSARGKRWLILQSENSTRRLQHDLHLMMKSLDVTREEHEAIERNLVIHTMEGETDFCMQLDMPSDVREIERAIQFYNPDFVVFDPLNTFAGGDLNNDQDMRKVCLKIGQLVKRSNPLRVPLVIHHALTGKNGAAKAIDWDRASFARNSKVLHAWTRSQFNLAPRHPEDTSKLILGCGKCSDGKEFAPLGLAFNADTNLYSIDPSFDLMAFKLEMAGNAKRTSRSTTTTEIAELVRDHPGLTRSELKRLVERETGLCESKAYQKITATVVENKIALDPTTKLFLSV
jgi:hypothetical protein